jgi:hypothetical protein
MLINLAPFDYSNDKSAGMQNLYSPVSRTAWRLRRARAALYLLTQLRRTASALAEMSCSQWQDVVLVQVLGIKEVACGASQRKHLF